MKAHKVTLLIIDFDALGPEEVKVEIENVSYPNDCISPNVVEIETVDIGEWNDDHPLNNADTMKDAMENLFKKSGGNETYKRMVGEVNERRT
jgi:hypothetical protein